jgi:hypothetical protein
MLVGDLGLLRRRPLFGFIQNVMMLVRARFGALLFAAHG